MQGAKQAMVETGEMKMRTLIAVIRGDEIYNAHGQRIDEPRAVAGIASAVAVWSDDRQRHRNGVPDLIDPPAMGAVEEIVAMLAQIVKLAQTLSANDQRRVREFVVAAQSTLNATTRMETGDQRVFEAALRNAAR